MRIDKIVSLAVAGTSLIVVGTKQIVCAPRLRLTAIDTAVGVAMKTLSVSVKMHSATEQTV